jgi:phasin family protein
VGANPESPREGFTEGEKPVQLAERHRAPCDLISAIFGFASAAHLLASLDATRPQDAGSRDRYEVPDPRCWSAQSVFDKATRMGEQAQDCAQKSSDQFQRAAEGGWEAAGRSISEVNRGFQALAAEMTEYSKKTFDDAVRTWEQLIGVKSLEQAIEIQSQYSKRVYENHMAEMTKLGEMYARMVRDAAQPVEQASRLR